MYTLSPSAGQTPATATRPYWDRSLRWLLLLVIAGTTFSQSGCVRRRITIRSTPPGALVYIDNYEIGTTPVSTEFIYYGTRQFRLIKDGYETLTTMQTIDPPFYQYVPLDFVAENLVPWEIKDQRIFDFTLRPQVMVPNDQLLQRAGDMRMATRTQAILPVLTDPRALGPAMPLGPENAPLMQPGVLLQPNTAPQIAPQGPGGMVAPGYGSSVPAEPIYPLPGTMPPSSAAPPAYIQPNVPPGGTNYPSTLPPGATNYGVMQNQQPLLAPAYPSTMPPPNSPGLVEPLPTPY